MDIRAQLLKEHGRRNAETIAAYVGDDPERFATLMHCLLDDMYRVGQRAAYSVGLVCEAHPHLAAPYLKRMLATLDAPVHEAVQRNSIRTMQFCELPEELHGRITEVMFARIADPQRSIAQRAFAITVAGRMVKLYPELMGEFRSLLEQASIQNPSPGIRSRVAKALRLLGTKKGPHLK